MSEEKKVFLAGKKMSELEIRAHFLKKAGSRKGSFEQETQRLITEIEDFKSNWLEKNIGRFLDSEPGQRFLKGHEDKTPDEIFEIMVRESNLAKLYNIALKKKMRVLEGAVE